MIYRKITNKYKGIVILSIIAMLLIPLNVFANSEELDEWMPDQNLQNLIVEKFGLNNVSDITKDLLLNGYISINTTDQNWINTNETTGMELFRGVYLYSDGYQSGINESELFESSLKKLEPYASKTVIYISGNLNKVFGDVIDFRNYNEFDSINFDPHNVYPFNKTLILTPSNFDSFKINPYEFFSFLKGNVIPENTPYYFYIATPDSSDAISYRGDFDGEYITFNREQYASFSSWEGIEININPDDIYPSTPSISGYFTDGHTAFLNITLNIRFEQNKYNVTFDKMNGTLPEVKTVFENEVVERPTSPTKEGFNFQGWYEDTTYDTEWNFSNLITKDITLYAKWEEEIIPVKEYTVTYIDGVNGTVFTDETFKAKEGEATPAYSKEITRYGYTFEGWSPEVSPTVTGDAVYVAQWKKIEEPVKKFTITYTDGTDNESIFKNQVKSVKEGSITPIFAGNPKQEGYTFEGWSPKVEETVTKDVTYVAQWKKIEEPVKEFTITYTDGTVNESIFKNQVKSVKEGSITPIFAGNPKQEGYTFEGWSPKVEETVTKDVTYVAQWKKIEEPIKPTDPTKPVAPEKPTLPETGVSNNHFGLLTTLLGNLLVGLRLTLNKTKKLSK
ncbi:InlB B-repeat-containing protein [Erysipelothrix sp. HDW6A]|uniref:InlB B-repeat-containing protein n=1 Tax=Erysipelothrix sp. HDW6A TaxID=2714928 RepID=UPI00140AB1E4|nr:InlB B-repeat-containing protein [Erysipelothrix sp. HDW6A]QIK57032.1 InlB B-repeat-containing protein [Erysipelothrix sp. HDW6A]